MLIYNMTEMARVTGVPLSYLLHRGQSVKVFSQLLRRAGREGLLLPTHARDESAVGDGGVAYEGATVLDAKAGYYEVPIATLDFASLYPSIMRAHNLCYTTLVPADRRADYAEAELTLTPTGDCFVRPEVRRGLLPAILDDLLSARKRARALIKTTDDPMMRGVLEGRQLALKLSANSVYGFTGATVGKLPCLAISASTTAFGRRMIDETRSFVLREYTVANGYAHDADVVYGDTDSVMVRFGCADVAEAMRLGALAADQVTTLFPAPVQLEFEKVYHPYLLMGKKRYAGMLWTCADRHDKLDTKGIETVRRDNCAFARNTIAGVLQRVLVRRDVPGSVEYVKGRIEELLTGRVDISELVITKGLTRDVSEYATRAAHVELAAKRRKRHAATAPRVGDRVPYVILRGHKTSKTYELAEDPVRVVERGLPIDYRHYLEHHLKLPLTRIYAAILPDVERTLFSGPHTMGSAPQRLTRSVEHAAGISRFARVVKTCAGCRTTLSDADRDAGLCAHCRVDAQSLYVQSMLEIDALAVAHHAHTAECQRCQRSVLHEVICANRDCALFYRRIKTQNDLREARARFDAVEW